MFKYDLINISSEGEYSFVLSLLFPMFIKTTLPYTLDSSKQKITRLEFNTILELTTSSNLFIIKISLLGFGLYLKLQDNTRRYDEARLD